MVSLSPYTMYNLNNLNDESTRVAHQMSTGRLLQNGSDDSTTYTEILNIEDKLRTYRNLQTQVQNTVAQNEVADSTMTQIKEQLDTVRNELMKALNSGINRSTREAMAVNIDGIKTTLQMLANTSVNGEYVFTGSDTTIKPFVENSEGEVEYVGDGILRRVPIDPGVYRERGVHGFEVMMYNTDTATDGETLTFSPRERVIDENGHEWKFLTDDFNEVSDFEYLYLDGDPTKDKIRVKVATSEINGDMSAEAPYKFETDAVTKEGRILMAKHNYFEDIDRLINALNGYAEDGATVIDNTEVNDILAEELDKANEIYDSVNVSHAKLGGRDKIFINASERISSQIKHFDVLLNEAGAADLSKVAMESQSLELLYTSLYSTISKMNNLSLINFVK